YGIPGAALGVVHDGRLVYARGFGYANLSTHAKVQPDSLFRVASITKTFTQTAIEKLVEEKKLSLSDDAFRILTLKPPRSSTLTRGCTGSRSPTCCSTGPDGSTTRPTTRPPPPRRSG